MNSIRSTITVLTVALVALAGLSGCAPRGPKADISTPQVFNVAFRRYQPEPVYRRVRWVYLPEVLPSAELPDSDAGNINPVYDLRFEKTTLQQAASALASAARYESYCASTIAKQKISLRALGTVDELANAIAAKAGVHVVIDHTNRQVRFLAHSTDSNSVAPTFFQNEGASMER